MELQQLGWNQFFENNFQEFNNKGFYPARVSQEQKNLFWVYTEEGEQKAVVADSLFLSAFSNVELPAVGDWVAVSKREGSEKLFIEAILPRQSKFSRKGKNTYGRNFSKEGGSDEQIISANIDTVFLVLAMDRDFNLRKIERYLTLIWDSGSKPVIILNKCDEHEDYSNFVNEAESVAMGTPIHAVSATEYTGIENLLDYLEDGKTIAVIGSSGVGKSSIINCLAGEEKQYVSHVREGDKRGKHTTTNRSLVFMPEGGILIDNPGMRDIQLSASQETLDHTFEDVVTLISQCRFSDCKHDTEPDCAVKEAIENGSLLQERYESYLKLQYEVTKHKKRAEAKELFNYNARSYRKHLDLKIKKHSKHEKKRDKKSKHKVVYDAY